MTKLLGVPPEYLTDVWPLAEPWIKKACAESNGRFETSDIARKVASREFQLWIEQAEGDDGLNPIQALGLTRLVQYPRLLACEFMACVGRDMTDWIAHISELERWAKSQNAAQLHAYARPGWERVLKPAGYRKTHVILEKNL